MKDVAGGRVLFISWAAYSRRSESVAEALGAEAVYIELMKGTPVVLVPLRYLLQAAKTIGVLVRSRPRVVGVMNPPIVLACGVYLYSLLLHGGRVRFFIDSHTGAFIGCWGRFLKVHRFLSRRALCTVVTNETLAQTVRGWGARAVVLPVEIPRFAARPAAAGSAETVCVINSFSADEPLDEILEAARSLPRIRFDITGRLPEDRRPLLLASKPDNVRYTGHVPVDAYLDLLNACDVAMVLVKYGSTLLQGAAEAVAMAKPLVTSDWPVLREYFSKGALYTDTQPAHIARTIEEALARKQELARESGELRETLQREWQVSAAQLVAVVDGGAGLRAGD